MGDPFRMVPPSQYSLLPPVGGGSFSSNNGNNGNNGNNFEPPYVPYPHMPFWTAAPLPFSPTNYPVNVLPPNARESLLLPKAPPFPGSVQSQSSGSNEVGKGSNSKSKNSKGRGRKGRPKLRDKSTGQFVKKNGESLSSGEDDGEVDHRILMGKIQELQNQLMKSQYESVMLREQLVASQMELSQLKDRGLVQATLKGGYQAQPQPFIPPPQNVGPMSIPTMQRDQIPGQMSSRGYQIMDKEAFGVKLDYNQLKSKLRPTKTNNIGEALQNEWEFEGSE